MRNTPPTNSDFGPTVLSLSVPGAAPPRRRVLGWLALFAAVSGVLLATALWLLRGEAVRWGEQITTALARVITEQTVRSIQAVDQRLQSAEHRLHDAAEEGRLEGSGGDTLLRTELKDLPYVRALWVTDAEGSVIHHSEGASGKPTGRDREYFLAPRAASGLPTAYVSATIRSRATGRLQMTVSRALRDEAGRFQGVIVAAIEPTYFQSVWSGLDVGSGGVVSLLHRNGQLLMRSPPDESMLGRDFSHAPLFTEWLPAAPEGLFHRPSPIDDTDRLVAYRTAPAYPQLVVMVGSSYANLLAPWRRFAVLTGGIWLLSVLAATALALQLQRQAARRHHLEQRFGELAQAMPQIVFITNSDGVVEFVNQCWSDVTGRETEEACGVRWPQLVHPEDAVRAEAEMAFGLASGEPVQAEVRLRYGDGTDHWQLVRARPNRNSAGEIVSWYGTSTDIHELKMAQEQLQGQADMMRLAGQLARLGSWELDPGSGRIFLSDIAAAMLDLPPGASLTLSEVNGFIHPAGRANAQRAFQRCMEEGEPFDMEGRVRTATGREAWIRSIGQPVRDATGRVVRLQGAQQDVTQRVRMLAEIRELNATLEERITQRTRELQRQEALFRTLAEQAPLPIWTVDPRGRAMFFSPAWYELVGGEPPRWTGWEWREVLHPDDLPVVSANWARCRDDGSVFQGTRRIRARDGTFHTTSYRATPVRGEDGRIAFWVGIDADITDLMANEAALRLANEQLRSFSYSVSHDLQSPLQRIGSFAQLLERELGPLPSGSKAEHFLQRIQANAEEMVQLVQGLLSLAEVSQAEVVRGRVDLSAIATEILEGLQAGSPGRQLRWRVEPGLVVLGDVRLMRSVMENLLGNAWKFTACRERPEIVVGGSVARGEFYVRDNGAGFEMEHADKLFGTFQRLHRQDEFPGTGIGLATVARAIQRQGGAVRGEGEPGRGATFRFTMPVPAAAASVPA
ncbi:PAS domain S-box protein [Ramlibacter henchirensis]|uniref:histidine kinase n=1 Tax=Ramlibacter henchirensis TaxID=204072 RepID=A0A4Z0BTX3_9BURK|nr:PAS domain-containing protein [Ramlibacter henchirensis]TFZ02291.1 PAS domain S-box protein [Ramlibacter henchirensis]